MFGRHKRLIFRLTTVAVSLAICLCAYLATRSPPPDAPAWYSAWYSIVPPLLAISLALLTNRLFLSLGAAVVAGGLLSAFGDTEGPFSWETPFLWLGEGVVKAGKFVVGTLYQVDPFEFHLDGFNKDNLGILAFVVLVMTMISVMLVGGGLQGVANWLLRFARSARSTQLVTMISGLVIFIDDYANTMIVGPTLRPVTDRQRISREKLAFLVDATAAPVAGIALISTWIGYEVGLLTALASDLRVDKGGYEMFLDALGFRFYCLGMIAFVFFNASSGEDFGPMAAAERRARTTGKLLADDATVMTSKDMTSAQPHPGARIHASVAVVPMLVLLGVFLSLLGGVSILMSDPGAILSPSKWRAVLTNVNSIPLLAQAAVVGLLVAMLLALTVARIPLPALARAMVVGARSALLPLSILILAWSLKRTCDDLHTGDFLANVLAGSLWPVVFPALVFIVASLISFSTGTSYGTMAILIPTAVPLAFRLDGDVYGPITVISIAAVLDGAIFGDHCSPISDTTIMSSTASSCDHLAHVRTQIPYSLVVAGFALCIGYLPAGLGASKWAGILGAAAAAGLLFAALRAFRNRRKPA